MARSPSGLSKDPDYFHLLPADDRLSYRVSHGTLADVGEALKDVRDVNAFGSSGETAMHAAARRGDPAILGLLMENGGDPDVTRAVVGEYLTPRRVAKIERDVWTMVADGRATVKKLFHDAAPSFGEVGAACIDQTILVQMQNFRMTLEAMGPAKTLEPGTMRPSDVLASPSPGATVRRQTGSAGIRAATSTEMPDKVRERQGALTRAGILEAVSDRAYTFARAFGEAARTTGDRSLADGWEILGKAAKAELTGIQETLRGHDIHQYSLPYVRATMGLFG